MASTVEKAGRTLIHVAFGIASLALVACGSDDKSGGDETGADTGGKSGGGSTEFNACELISQKEVTSIAPALKREDEDKGIGDDCLYWDEDGNVMLYMWYFKALSFDSWSSSHPGATPIAGLEDALLDAQEQEFKNVVEVGIKASVGIAQLQVQVRKTAPEDAEALARDFAEVAVTHLP